MLRARRGYREVPLGLLVHKAIQSGSSHQSAFARTCRASIVCSAPFLPRRGKKRACTHKSSICEAPKVLVKLKPKHCALSHLHTDCVHLRCNQRGTCVKCEGVRGAPACCAARAPTCIVDARQLLAPHKSKICVLPCIYDASTCTHARQVVAHTSQI